jgi:hypothetical protein
MRDLLWRIRESPKDYRYGGFRAALRWIVFGIAADEEDA